MTEIAEPVYEWIRGAPVCGECLEVAKFIVRVPWHSKYGVRAVGYCPKCGSAIIQSEYTVTA